MSSEFQEGQVSPAPVVAKKPKRRWGRIVLFTWLGIFVIFYVGAILWAALAPRGALGDGRGIALIRVDGVIAASGLDGGLFSASGVSPEDIIDQLREADNDPEIKAILLRVNSPGGTAASAQEIYEEVRRVEKPVVVSIADIGASGAYYIAAGADQIVASRASLVGSIGVIVQIADFRELYKKLGIDYVVIRQGKFKDLGNPARALTEEEKEILSAQSRVVYEQFISDVAKGRGMAEEEVEKLATGLVYPGTEALDMKLVDELGNYRDAVDLAAELGKIIGEPEIIDLREPTLFDILGGFYLEARKIASSLQKISAVQPPTLSNPSIR